MAKVRLDEEALMNLPKETLVKIIRLITDDASKDHLTSLYNKSNMEEIDISLRGKEYSLAMCDIDNFKDINDTYGHLIGDSVLSIIGDIIISAIRDGDLGIRYGGDEIIIILLNCNAKNMRTKCESIIKLIKKKCKQELKVEITMSIGIAETTGDFYETIGLADDLAYQSKNSGKDRITIYEDPDSKEKQR